MRRVFRAAAVACLLPGAGHGVRAADRTVALHRGAEPAKGIAALPSIERPIDEAERRINAALLRLDASARKAAEQCKADAAQPTAWERTVRVPMSGPRFLSYAITDIASCGGAYPDTSTMSIVYDLASGAPVDWATLLPPALTGKMTLETGADGTKMVTLSGQGLYALYLTGYRPLSGNAGKDAADDECRDVIATAGDGETAPRMMAWLDAAKDGLVVQPQGLAHAVQACADDVTIPTAALRALGARAVLVEALAGAHKPPAGKRD